MVAIISPPAARAGDAPPPDAALAKAFTESGIDIYKALAATTGNVVLSPISIGTAMSMVLAGARGETEKSLATILHHNLEPGGVPDANAALAAKLGGDKAESASKLLSANALMVTGEGKGISEDYRKLLADKFGAEIFPVAALADVNAWVGKKTEGKITEILKSLDPQSKAVILNAVYFKSAWATPFSKDLTKEAPFTAAGGKEIKVQMMHQDVSVPVVKRKGYRAARLPYANRALGLVVLLPDAVDGLAALEASLSSEEVAAVHTEITAANPQPVALALPRFKSETGADLLTVFAKLGLKPDGDFSGMTTEKQPFSIGQIMHKAVIEVSEAGTEAAASTAVEMVGRSLQPAPKPEPFVVDRPFIYLITEKETGAVLFMGRVSDPTK